MLNCRGNNPAAALCRFKAGEQGGVIRFRSAAGKYYLVTPRADRTGNALPRCAYSGFRLNTQCVQGGRIAPIITKGGIYIVNRPFAGLGG